MLLSRLTLEKFAEVVSMSTGTSTSTSTTPPAPKAITTPKTKGGVNTTLSQSRENSDLQPLERDSHRLNPSKMPAYGMRTKGYSKNSSMSKLEDRRILD